MSQPNQAMFEEIDRMDRGLRGAKPVREAGAGPGWDPQMEFTMGDWQMVIVELCTPAIPEGLCIVWALVLFMCSARARRCRALWCAFHTAACNCNTSSCRIFVLLVLVLVLVLVRVLVLLLLVVVVVCCCWLLLFVVVGCCWLLLVVVGCCWLWLLLLLLLLYLQHILLSHFCGP